MSQSVEVILSMLVVANNVPIVLVDGVNVNKSNIYKIILDNMII